MTEAAIEAFALAHVDGLIALVAGEGWTEYTADVERTYRALTAPGVTTPVATVGGRVVGAIQVPVRWPHPGPCFDAPDRRGPAWAWTRSEAASRAGSRGRSTTRRPHPNRGLLRAAWCEPLARFPPHS